MPRPRKPKAMNKSAPEAPLDTQASGQPYGQRGRLEAATKAVALPNNRPKVSTPSREQVLAEATAYQAPDLQLSRPTDFPNRPVTDGLDGPSQMFTPPVLGPNPDVLALAEHLPALELLASKPNASATTKALVRRIRSQLPPDFTFDRAE